MISFEHLRHPLATIQRCSSLRMGGSRIKTPASGGSQSVAIPVPAEKVWNLLVNFEKYPKILSSCTRIEIVFSSSRSNVEPSSLDLSSRKVKAGFTYMDYRTFKNNPLSYKFKTTVTRVDEDFDPVTGERVLATATDLHQSYGTATHTVVRLSDDSCLLCTSYAVVPTRFYQKAKRWLYRKWYAKAGQAATAEILTDFRRAALRSTSRR